MKKSGPLQRLLFVCLVLGSSATLSRAQTITTLTNFNGMNGSYPLGTLVQGSDGNCQTSASEGIQIAFR